MKHSILILASVLMLWGCKSENRNNQEVSETDTTSVNGSEIISEDPLSVSIEPISHATAVITWDGTTIYTDPVGGAAVFEGKERPDLVLISDIHGDHLNIETLQGLNLDSAEIIVPQAVHEKLPDSLQQMVTVLGNGETINKKDFRIKAIPMYNLREEAKKFHTKGRGNGYVLEKNGKRLYIAGDTGPIPEMRALENIDIALIPMNLPYTMPVEDAADAVLDFAPKTVYPYHFRGQNGLADVEKFKQLVQKGNPDIEVVLLDWYPESSSPE